MPSGGVDRRVSHRLEVRPPDDRSIAWFRKVLQAYRVTNQRSFPWRDTGRSAYELVIAEILLQRTKADHVSGMYRGFLSRFPNWSALADARLQEIQALLKPVGLWRRKAKSLRAISEEMVRRNGIFPTSRDELESIPAVGQYVASAILLLVYDRREPLLDSNMARLLERFFGPRERADIRYDDYLQRLSRRVLSKADAKLLNWAILDLAALVCRASNPRCAACPLASECWYYRLTRSDLKTDPGAAW